MNKVVTVNLNGRSYEIEEGAYDALRRYLDAAETSLADNPDKQEIISDLEQAIAEKFDLYRSTHKNVIALADMETALKEMGPVNVDAEKNEEKKTDSSSASNTAHAPKRLYRIQEGKVFSGVCAGLAAYFNIDVTLVRILFIILTILTHGGFAFAYFLMIFFIPEADTPAQKAQAYGAAMVTANDLIRRARDSYENIRNSPEWQKSRHEMKHQMKDWKRQWKQQQKNQRHQGRAHSYAYQYQKSPFWEAVQSIIGMVWFAFICYLGWFLYTHVPAAHAAFNSVGLLLEHWLQQFTAYVQAHIH